MVTLQELTERRNRRKLERLQNVTASETPPPSPPNPCHNKRATRSEELNRLSANYLVRSAAGTCDFTLLRDPNTAEVMVKRNCSPVAPQVKTLAKRIEVSTAFCKELYDNKVCKAGTPVEITEAFRDVYLPNYVSEIHDLPTTTPASVKRCRTNRLIEALYLKPLTVRISRLKPLLSKPKPILVFLTDPTHFKEEFLPNLFVTNEQQGNALVFNYDISTNPWTRDLALSKAILATTEATPTAKLQRHLCQVTLWNYVSFINIQSAETQKLPPKDKWRIFGTPEKPLTTEFLNNELNYLTQNRHEIISNYSLLQECNKPGILYESLLTPLHK